MKVVTLTGGTRGIGLAIAKTFAAAGAKVTVCSRKEPNVQAAVKSIEEDGGQVFGVAADVGNAFDIARLADNAPRLAVVVPEDQHRILAVVRAIDTERHNPVGIAVDGRRRRHDPSIGHRCQVKRLVIYRHAIHSPSIPASHICTW